MRKTKNKNDLLKIGKSVLSIERDAIDNLNEQLDEKFVEAVETILRCRGRVVLTGMGKSGIICRKIAATLISTGTQALFIHPSEAKHGDLGLITQKDVVIALSNSGETKDIIELIPHLKMLRNKIISITSNPDSTLSKQADVSLSIVIQREGCPLNLAPMASTTTMLALGDAISAALMDAKKFNEDDFSLFHPEGRLGQILLRVSDLMITENLPIVIRETPMSEVIKGMVCTNYGAILIRGSKGHLRGIITDGDIKRLFERDEKFLKKNVSEVMNQKPCWILEDKLAKEALIKMEDNRITVLPVLSRNKKITGLLHIHDIVKHNYGGKR